MFILTEIKNRISKLEGGVFQKLCDSYLFLKGYKGIHSLGSQAETFKTTKGTPDTYFKNEEGKYIFVEYTTNTTGLFNKMKDDLEKCFDKEMSGVEVEDISEIIYCHTSSNITPGQDKELIDICKTHGVKLNLYGIDSIANDIHYYHPHLAKEFLDLIIDTGQIMSTEIFEKDYNNNKMLAPLSTKFQFREKELKDIFESLEKSEVVLITGAAGVGKTKLVLELAKKYGKEKSEEVYCIKNKNLLLYEDLKKYISLNRKALIFIDDGNEVDEIEQVLDLMKNSKGNLKIIITVRNYAKEDLISKIEEYTKPVIQEIVGLEDNQIMEFLEKNLGIKNDFYKEEILKLSKGNPRMAYMVGVVAKEEKTLNFSKSVIQIYDKYYKKTIKLLSDKTLQCMGIVSLFNVVELNNLEKVQPILELFNISEKEFKENIEKLYRLEFVEIELKTIVRMPDQCFRDYIAYYLFIKQEERKVEFSKIFNIVFTSDKHQIVRVVQTCLTTFESEDNKRYLKDECKKVWNKLEIQGKESELREFVKCFYALDQIRALKYIKNKLDTTDENILDLLTGYKDSEYLSEALELIFEYCKKYPDKIEEVNKLLIRDYSIDRNSYSFRFRTQEILLKTFEANINIEVIQKLFFEVVEHFLRITFSYTESKGYTEFIFCKVSMNLSEDYKKFRKNIWGLLENVFKLTDGNYEKIKILTSLEYEGKNEIFEVDKTHIIKILKEISVKNPFESARLYDKFKRQRGLYENSLESLFDNEKWKIYDMLLIRYGDGLTYEEREVSFEEKITNYIKTNSSEKFIKNLEIIEEILSGPLDEIICEVSKMLRKFNSTKENLEKFLDFYFSAERRIRVNPCTIIDKMIEFLGEERTYELLWSNKIWNNNFLNKNEWRITYFYEMSKKEPTFERMNKFLEFLVLDGWDEINYNHWLSYYLIGILDNFIKINNNIYVEASNIIYAKHTANVELVKEYFYEWFNSSEMTPERLLRLYQENLTLLKDIYFLITEKSYGYDGEFFGAFVAQDFDYLVRYMDGLLPSDFDSPRILTKCWLNENYIEIFDYVFYKLVEKKEKMYFGIYYILKESFLEESDRKKEWVKHLIEENYNNDNIEYVFQIVCQLTSEFKIECISRFFELNKDFIIFKRLSIEPRLRSYVGSEIPLLEGDIELYQELLLNMNGINFLEHKELINKRIDWLEKKIEKIRKNEYVEKNFFN